jgi:hypothetical protein
MSTFQSLLKFLREKAQELWAWLKPDKKDHLLVQIGKMPFKILAVLFAAALSPIALIALAFAFFAAL